MFYHKVTSGGSHRSGDPRAGTGLRLRPGHRKELQEDIHLDYSLDSKILIGEVLRNISLREGLTKGRRLSYLNALVKLLQYIQTKNGFASALYGYSIEEICLCLRTCLINEAAVVRMAALRVLRYLINTEEDVVAMSASGIPYLVVRSLDVILNNKGERLQAARFCQRLLAIPNGASKFPNAITRALVAVGFDGLTETDSLHKGSLSILCQLAILNPAHFVENGGVRVLLHNILGCTTPMVLESMLGSLLHLLNVPETRNTAGLNLHALVAPLTDPHFKLGIRDHPDKDNDEQEIGHKCAKTAIGTTLRSWSGIAHFCQNENSGLQALIDALYIEQLQIRQTILNLLCEIFGLKFPTWTDEVSVALSAVDTYYPQESWKLQHGFVVEEASLVLPHLAITTPNITANHKALLVYCFAKRGLLDALVEVIVTSDTFISVRASVLLGELLTLVDRYLPVECFDPSQCIPTLIQHAMNDESAASTSGIAASSASSAFQSSVSIQLKQHRALEAITILKTIHHLKSRVPKPSSMFLDTQLQYAGYTAKQRDKFVDRLGQVQLTRILKQDIDSGPSKLLKEAGVVLSKDPISWQWELISALLRWSPESLKKVDDSSWKTFLRRLTDFYKPTNNVFARMELTNVKTMKYARVGCDFIQFLSEGTENFVASTYLDELLADIVIHLKELLVNTQNPFVCFFSPNKLETTASQFYFLFLGKLTQSRKGSKALEGHEMLKLLLTIVREMQHECYAKLIISSLFYGDDVCRRILSAALICSNEATRLYATQFLRVLVRAKLPGFSKWGMELLVNQLNVIQRTIQLTALDILEEAIHDKMYLESLISLRPSLTHLGDRGLLVVICFVSLPSGYKYLLEANFLKQEIDKWKKSFNKRYVELVEVLVRDSVSTLRRGEDGKYPKRPSANTEQSKFVDIYVPPHLYGQLAQHKHGLDMLLEQGDIYLLLDIVNRRKCDNAEETRELKASMWALGHFASSVEALPIVEEHGVLESMVHLAAWCPILSVRHTAFYCLCLISSIEPGAELLHKYDWHAMPRNHHEFAPIWGANIHAHEKRKTRVTDLDSEIDLLERTSLNLEAGSTNLMDDDDASEYQVDDLEDQMEDDDFDMSSHGPHQRSHSESQDTSGLSPKVPEFMSSSLRPGATSTLKWLFNHRGGSLKGFRSRDNSTGSNGSGNFATISASNSRRWARSLSENVSSSFQSSPPEASPTSKATSSTNVESLIQPLSPIPSSPSLATIMSNQPSLSNLSPPSRETTHALTDPGIRLGSPNNLFYRSIIRKPVIQVPSSCESDIFPAYVGSTRRQPLRDKATSLDRHFMLTPKDLFSESKLRPLLHSSMTSISTPSFRTRPEAETRGPCFMGLCLPKDFNMIFLSSTPAQRLPSASPSNTSDPDLQASLQLKMGSEEVFEFHSQGTCMGCVQVLNGKIIPCPKGDAVKHHSMDSLVVLENGDANKNSFMSVGSFLSNSSIEGDTRKVVPDSVHGKNLLRKEIIRLVTSMISCVGAKSNEQGLIRLKQKFPKAFHDVCLYSELCTLLSHHNVRFALRRFIQELFLDLPYDEFYTIAASVLNPDSDIFTTSATTTDTSECSTVVEVPIIPPPAVFDTDQSIAEIDTDDPTPYPSPGEELDSDYIDLK